MKKKTLLILITFVLVLLLGSTLFACNGDDINNLKATYETLQLPLNGSMYISNYITYEGSGELNYSVENTAVLQLEDDKVTGIGTGTGRIIISSETETVSINIIVVNDYEVVIKANDNSTSYDGTVKNISLTYTALPEGSTIKYYCNEQEFSGATEPGTYLVNVIVSVPEPYDVTYTSGSATLFIDRATVDMGNIKFNSVAYNYDGVRKQIFITGALPDYVSVSYENNTGIDAGVYRASAVFSVDTKYYYEILTLTARLTINKLTLNYSTLGFTNTSLLYNGNYQYIKFTDLPEGLTVEYYLGQTLISDITAQFKDAGRYEITAKFSANEFYTTNYVFDTSVTAVLTITKADFINNLTWSSPAVNFTYDGNAIDIGDDIYLSGTTPCGVNNEYAAEVTWSYYRKVVAGTSTTYIKLTDGSNTFTDAGTYTIVGRFSMPAGYDTNYNALPDMEYSLIINRAVYDTTQVSYTGENFTFDGTSHSFAVIRPVSFDTDITIKYAINENSAGYTSETTTAPSIKDAGSYLLKATFTYNSATYVKNYQPISNIVVTVTVGQKAIDLGTVNFTNAAYTYETGVSRSLAVVGDLPENIQVAYTANNAQTNAGLYIVTATFGYYIDSNAVAVKNYYFTENSVAVTNTKSAVLTINKATYQASEVPVDYQVIGGIYSPDKTLANYTILDGNSVAATNIRWANTAVVPTVNASEYLAYYNKDSVNYNNYSVNISIAIAKAEVDAGTLSISSQFLPYTGLTVTPKYTLTGYTDATKVLKITATSSNSLISLGAYAVSAAFSLADTDNYKYLNDIEPLNQNINVYIYNSSLYSYTGTQLTNYYGTLSYLEVLSGTTSIKNGAIANNTYLTEIKLPDTLIKSGMSNGAINISTLTSLQTIALPFTGVNNTDLFGSIFGLSANTSLPATLQYVTVTNETAIANDTFKNCQYLKTITYSYSVSSVGSNAFYGCNAATSISIGTAMTSIGAGAFRYCFHLLNLSLPFIGATLSDTTSTITYLFGESTGDNVYTNYDLSVFTITGNVTVLPAYAFANLSNLATLTLPGSVSAIGAEAFSGLNASVNLNTNITAITDKMFYNYKGTALAIPATVTQIGSHAFDGASRLASLTIPKAVTSIGTYAFKGVTCNVTFEALATITAFGAYSFSGYKGTGIIIPSSVTSLGDYAFSECGMTSVSLPSTLTTMGKHIFESSISLTTISINCTTITDYMFQYCTALTTINTPDNSLTTIGNYAFYGCTSIISVLLKSNVTSVGTGAFNNCTLMDSCEIRATTVITLGSNAFRAGLTIRVNDPAAYTAAYQEYQFLVWQS